MRSLTNSRSPAPLVGIGLYGRAIRGAGLARRESNPQPPDWRPAFHAVVEGRRKTGSLDSLPSDRQSTALKVNVSATANQYFTLAQDDLICYLELWSSPQSPHD